MERNDPSAMDRLRDHLEAMARTGASFTKIEDEIEATGLSGNEKAALWLLSRSMRDRGAQLMDARELIRSVAATA